jgi:putative ABC transport system permease protein
MFAHLFKLIWNKRKHNFLLMVEIFISFLVIFAVFTMLVYYYRNYKKPLGVDYENVWVISYNNALQTNNNDSLSLYYETFRQTIKALPQVKDLSFTSPNTPFSHAMSQSGFSHNNQQISGVNWYFVEDGYKNVLNIKLLEGRWFNKQDGSAKNHPVVINAALKEKLFGNSPATGKIIGDARQQDKMLVIGVAQDIKQGGDFTSAGIAVFNRADTNAHRWLGRILIKVSPDADAAFEGRLYKTVSNYMQNANISIDHMANMRKEINTFYLIPVIILLIVAVFLTINVTLGLFGVLWYNINKRKAEIGLRRAVGASGSAVSWQLVAEAMILATISLLAGSFLAVQFPLLRIFDLPAIVYITALILAILFIYLLVLLCSLYPGKQAAAVYPAIALHED